MSNPDLATVENRLQALENRVAKNATKAKSRVTLTVVIMACLLEAKGDMLGRSLSAVVYRRPPGRGGRDMPV